MQKKKLILIVVSVLLVLALGFGCVYLFAFYLPQKSEREERERLVREYYENKFVIYEAENQKYADYEVDVAFLGDSLTDGYDLEKYYPEYLTANRGIGGETTHGLEDRMQLSLYDLKPKVAVMLIGGNNLDTMLDNYESILIGIKENLPQTKVVLVSLTAMGGDYARKNTLAAYNNVTVKKLAEKYGFFFVDIFTPLFDETTGEIYTQYTSDSVHLTAKGYEVFTSAVKPVLCELLGQ